MSKKLMSITVNGKERTWSFNFYADPQYLDKWQADGLDIVQIENVIPMWVWEAGLTKPYCWLQDIFNFKWPWHK